MSLPVRQFLGHWMAAGTVVYLLGFFLLPHTSALKIAFYFFILLPGLLSFALPSRERAFFSNPIVISSLALSLYLALSSLWAPGGNLTAFLDFCKPVIFIFVWLRVCARVAAEYPGLFNALPQVLIWTGTATAVITMGLYLYSAEGELLRMTGLGVINNELVAASAFSAVSVMAFTLGRQRYRDHVITPYAVPVLTGAVAVVLTQSRGPMAYLALALVVTLALYPPPLRQLLKGLALALVAGIAVVAVAPDIQWRGFSWSFRDEIWDAVYHRYLDAPPLWGAGVREDTSVQVVSGHRFDHSHNAWLETLWLGGLIGLGLALWNLWACFRHFRQLEIARPVHLWLLIGCMSAFTTGSAFLAKPGWMWLLYWLPAGLLCGHQIALTAEKPASVNAPTPPNPQ